MNIHKQKVPTSGNQPALREDPMIAQYNQLKDFIMNDSNAQIMNLQQHSNNLNEIFGMVKIMMKRMISKTQALKQENAMLRQKLKNVSFESQGKIKSENEANYQCDQFNQDDEFLKLEDNQIVNSRLSKAFTRKLMSLEGSSKNSSKSKSQKQNPDQKINLRQQFVVIKQFVSNYLADKIQSDQARRAVIPKKTLVNLYFKWNLDRNRQLLVDTTSRLQMQITNEVKSAFPNVQVCRKHFKGLRFKPEHETLGYFTDRTRQANDDEDYGDIESQNFDYDGDS